MQPLTCKILATLLPAILVPLAVLAGPAPTLEENRQALEKWQQNPQRLARLKRNQTIFRRLPTDAQERLRKLDRDLNEEGPAMRSRLKGVMDRYSTWLDSLPEEDRKSVVNAPDRRARLERIRELRQQQWVRQLPRPQQEQINKLQGKDRTELVRKLWQEDLDRRADWQVAERHWDLMLHKPQQLPLSRDTLPRETRQFLDASLKPLLTADEDRRLREAEGKWPRYPRLLVDLADSHPLSVLGPIGPTRIEDLPSESQRFLKGEKAKKLHERLKQAEGKWPEFGVVMHELRKSGEKRHLDLKREFVPSHPKDFPTAVQHFIETRLLLALADDEQKALAKAEGNWPAYPKLIVELARKHNLPIPADPLPGLADGDKYRARSVSAGEER